MPPGPRTCSAPACRLGQPPPRPARRPAERRFPAAPRQRACRATLDDLRGGARPLARGLLAARRRGSAWSTATSSALDPGGDGHSGRRSTRRARRGTPARSVRCSPSHSCTAEDGERPRRRGTRQARRTGGGAARARPSSLAGTPRPVDRQHLACRLAAAAAVLAASAITATAQAWTPAGRFTQHQDRPGGDRQRHDQPHGALEGERAVGQPAVVQRAARPLRRDASSATRKTTAMAEGPLVAAGHHRRRLRSRYGAVVGCAVAWSASSPVLHGGSCLPAHGDGRARTGAASSIADYGRLPPASAR